MSSAETTGHMRSRRQIRPADSPQKCRTSDQVAQFAEGELATNVNSGCSQVCIAAAPGLSFSAIRVTKSHIGTNYQWKSVMTVHTDFPMFPGFCARKLLDFHRQTRRGLCSNSIVTGVNTSRVPKKNNFPPSCWYWMRRIRVRFSIGDIPSAK